MYYKKVFLFSLLIGLNVLQAQIGTVTEKYQLDTAIDESSGLLFFNHRLITFNDSGGASRLYEMDSISNHIIRSVEITNATNVDWEALAQDDLYIYIGDFGNNLGNRRDLKVYRIAKADYLSGNQVTAETIHFSYSDQVDFTANSNTNYDAEAMIVKGDNILIFSKNHGNQGCRLYIMPKAIGTHTAVNYDSCDTQGMITGATYDAATSQVFLTGYDDQLYPFVMHLSGYSGDRLFTGNIEKTTILSQGSQVEAIANVGTNRYFMTSETLSYGNVVIPAKLFAFNSQYATHIEPFIAQSMHLFPNPSNGIFSIEMQQPEKGNITIFNPLGQMVFQKVFAHQKVLHFQLPKNVYFVRMHIQNQIFHGKIVVK